MVLSDEIKRLVGEPDILETGKVVVKRPDTSIGIHSILIGSIAQLTDL